MTSFTVHDVESAPEGSRPGLARAAQAFGSIPNLFGVFAESPAALQGYAALAGALDEQAALDPTELQTVLLTVSFENDCDYCMAAHSTIAGMRGVPAAVVDALREGTALPDGRLEALRTFTRRMVEQRGDPGEAALQAFLDAGYTRRHALDVVAGIALKTLSNYTNHLAETPLDAGFAGQAWRKPAAGAVAAR